MSKHVVEHEFEDVHHRAVISDYLGHAVTSDEKDHHIRENDRPRRKTAEMVIEMPQSQ